MIPPQSAQPSPLIRRRFVVLDRDGTINVDCHYLSDPAQLELLPAAAEGLRQMQALGLGLIVITNQSGIGRGFFDWVHLNSIHERLCDLLREEGVYLEGIYVCPHCPQEHCRCRKPATGLVTMAAEELGFDPKTSIVIGDKPSDMALGQRLGATTILIRTGYGFAEGSATMVTADYIVDDLQGAAQVIRGVAGARSYTEYRS